MNTLEVRCCCQPTKLLGYLPDPGPDRWSCKFPLKTPLRLGVVGLRKDFPEIRLEIAEIVLVPGQQTQRAYKADETPIETLRLIPGFVEAKP